MATQPVVSSRHKAQVEATRRGRLLEAAARKNKGNGTCKAKVSGKGKGNQINVTDTPTKAKQVAKSPISSKKGLNMNKNCLSSF